MPRRKRMFNPELPIHIYSRCINREWFGVDMDVVWEVMEAQLFFMKYAYGVDILSFVLMNNHFHMLARAPQNNICQAMAFFLRETSRAIRKPKNRINQLWAERFSSCLITTDHYFHNVYKYVYRNPVEAGMVSRVEDYPYSTLRQLLFRTRYVIPVAYDHLLYDSNITSCLNWLNSCPSDENKNAMRLALKKSQFQLPIRRNEQHALEDELY